MSSISGTARVTFAAEVRSSSRSNVRLLEWSAVDLGRRVAWIHPDQAKARKAISVPLNADAMAILRSREGIDPRFVFAFEGRAIQRINGPVWHGACTRAGIEDFRWHDLRHTWASWHVQDGTPLHALKELGGWATMDMVLRYAHLGADHLADYAANISGPRVVAGKKSGTNLAQRGDKGGTKRGN
jgi:integrase